MCISRNSQNSLGIIKFTSLGWVSNQKILRNSNRKENILIESKKYWKKFKVKSKNFQKIKNEIPRIFFFFVLFFNFHYDVFEIYLKR